jgi:hypothetical protein
MTSYDHGAEPSSRADFFDFSDVWNRRTNDPDVPDANNRPQNQDPQPTAVGHNFAFARVSRETSGTDETVNLHFLYSDGGVGVNFVDAGTTDTTLHFNSGDVQNELSAGNSYQWELPSGASNHVCLAVQIYTTADPFITPSLTGHAPGWPSTDLMIINDNNKAQRNMQVLGFGGMSGGTGMSAYAIAHNAATFERDMVIGVDFDPDLLRHVKRPEMQVIGGPGPRPGPIAPHTAVTLPRMAPGENRWIEIRFDGLPGKETSPMPIQLYEVVNNLIVNGYSIAPRSISEAAAVRANLTQHEAVFSRLAQTYKDEKAKGQAASAAKLLKEKEISNGEYLAFLKQNSTVILEVIDRFIQESHAKDAFGTSPAAKRLIAEENLGQALADHVTLLNKLDATQTMIQKSQGDPADILQMVRWEKELYSTNPRLKRLNSSAFVVKRSQEFVDDYGKRKRSASDYPDLMRALLKSLHETAKELDTPRAKLEAEVDQIESNLGSLNALENAHRSYLLALYGLSK